MEITYELLHRLTSLTTNKEPLVLRPNQHGDIEISIGENVYVGGAALTAIDILDAIKFFSYAQGYEKGQKEGHNYFDHQNGPLEIK